MCSTMFVMKINPPRVYIVAYNVHKPGFIVPFKNVVHYVLYSPPGCADVQMYSPPGCALKNRTLDARSELFV